MVERWAYHWHPRHEWRGIRVHDRDEHGQPFFWNTLVLGWWSVDVIPPDFAKAIAKVLDEMKRRKP